MRSISANRTPKTKKKVVIKKEQEVVIEFGMCKYEGETCGYKKSTLYNLVGIETMSKYDSFLEIKNIEIEDNKFKSIFKMPHITLPTFCEHFYTSIEDKINIIYQMCKTISLLHKKNIIHMNINNYSFSICSPNKLITNDLDYCFKILDSEENLSNQSLRYKNRIHYYSPKILESMSAQKEYSISKKDDIWALGILILEMIKSNFKDYDCIDQVKNNYKAKFDEKLRKKYLNGQIKLSIDKNYAHKLIELLDKMLTIDENTRIDIEKVLVDGIFEEFYNEEISKDIQIKIPEIPEVGNVEILESHKFVPGKRKFDNNFREQIKVLVNYFIENKSEIQCQIMFLAIDIFHRCYTLIDKDEALLCFCSLFLSFKYYYPMINIETFIDRHYFDFDINELNNITMLIIINLKSDIYSNQIYESCEYVEDLIFLYDEIIMNKNFIYFQFIKSEWEGRKIANRQSNVENGEENLQKKEYCKVKDLFI